MAGLAFLPWEDWLARLLHPLYVSLRRWMSRRERQTSLARSERWPQTEGSIHEVKWDSTLPREEVLYSYSSKEGYYSGFHWRWFDRKKAGEVRLGDRVVLRYNPGNPAESVFVEFQQLGVSVTSVPMR